MVDVILQFLGLAADRQGPQHTAASADTESVRRIVDALEHMEPERARFVAAFSYVLSRVAQADLEISEQETRVMEQLVRETTGLSEPESLLAVQIAKTQARLHGSTEDFVVTREFEKLASHEQKLALLECMFAVANADQSISGAEDNEIRKIAQQLRLSHGDFVSARSAYREHMELFRSRGERD